MMDTVPFDSIFQVDLNGNLTTKHTIRLNGITVAPGVGIPKGANVGGVTLSMFAGRDFQVKHEEDSNTWVIRGIY
jgi:hypothetical protein